MSAQDDKAWAHFTEAWRHFERGWLEADKGFACPPPAYTGPKKAHTLTASTWRSRWKLFWVFQRIAWRLLFRGRCTVRL